MKILLLFLWALAAHAQMLQAIVAGGNAQPAVTQACSANSQSASIGSITCTFGAAVKAGDGLSACVTWSAGSSQTITWTGDSATFTADFTNVGFSNGNGNYYQTCVHVLSATGGGSTITATPGSAFGMVNIIAVEITGQHGVTSHDDGIPQSSPGSTTILTGGLININGPSLIVSFLDANQTITPSMCQSTGGPTAVVTQAALTGVLNGSTYLQSQYCGFNVLGDWQGYWTIGMIDGVMIHGILWY